MTMTYSFKITAMRPDKSFETHHTNSKSVMRSLVRNAQRGMSTGAFHGYIALSLDGTSWRK